jgi:hypothetical protein
MIPHKKMRITLSQTSFLSSAKIAIRDLNKNLYSIVMLRMFTKIQSAKE